MRIRIAIITISAAVLSVTAASGADTGIKTKVESFPVSSVRLTSGPFKHAEDMDIRYLLALDPDRTTEACCALQKLDDIFHVGGGIGVGLFAEVYLRAGKTKEALEYLEKLGLKIDAETLDKLIEAAVFDLPKYFVLEDPEKAA